MMMITRRKKRKKLMGGVFSARLLIRDAARLSGNEHSCRTVINVKENTNFTRLSSIVYSRTHASGQQSDWSLPSSAGSGMCIKLWSECKISISCCVLARWRRRRRRCSWRKISPARRREKKRRATERKQFRKAMARSGHIKIYEWRKSGEFSPLFLAFVVSSPRVDKVFAKHSWN